MNTRLQRLQQAMLQSGLSGLVYGLGANFQYFSRLPIKWQREHEPAEPDCLLVVTTKGPALAILGPATADQLTAGECQVEVAASRAEVVALLRHHLPDGRIGVSRRAEKYLRDLIGQALPDAVCRDAEAMGAELRYVKEETEIAALRKVVALTDMVMAQVAPFIRPGITQPALQARIAAAGLALGAQDVSFPPAALYVKSGSQPSENPFVYPAEQGLVAGTSVAFDFGFVLDGYCSDFGRSFYSGPAPEHISGAYRALQDGQCHLIRQLRPGLPINQFYPILETFLDERGYGDRLRARLPDGTLGHQIGVDLHEDPWLRPTIDLVLQPGMVMAIEPKLWLPGEYYLRVEDIVLITAHGAESLTQADRNAFELPL